MNNVELFHDFAHVIISFFGAVILLVLYLNIRKRFSDRMDESEEEGRVDKGLLYLSLSMFVWVVAGLCSLNINWFDGSKSTGFQLLSSILSLLNNLFLLLALYYFRYSPKFLYKNKKNLRYMIAAILFVSLITFLLFLRGDDYIINGINVVALPDLLISIFLSILLMISFYQTLFQRGLKLVAYLSVLFVLLILISQLPEVFIEWNDAFTNLLIKIIAKTSLISIFLVLATSWVMDLANTPKTKELEIKFIDWCQIRLSIPSKGIIDKQFDFGSRATQFKNLLKFSIRRKYGSPEDQSIEVGNYSEIKNQSYLSRILENINDSLSEEESLERKDIFTFIGDGKYRLRILPQHIEIQEALLHEFLSAAENEDYKGLIGDYK